MTQPNPSEEGNLFASYDYDMYYPTWPDTGERVTAKELSGWLQMILDDPEIEPGAKAVAKYIVHMVRAQSN